MDSRKEKGSVLRVAAAGLPATFGELLRQHRLSAGFTQEQLAERSGLSVDAISALERGSRRRPTMATLTLLGTALRLTAPDRDAFMTTARPPAHARQAIGAGGDRCRLPIPPTPLVGRDRELGRAVALLRRPHVRLVTLTGAAGVGKTRLGLAVAWALRAEFPDGTFFASLAAVHDTDHVGRALVQALDVPDQDPAAPLEELARHLGERRVLLLVDNFEHLLPAASLLAEVLTRCARLRLLVTSRDRLRIRCEHELPVPPLGVPGGSDHPPPAVLARVPAVALFVDRAAAGAPDFRLTARNAPFLAEICRRLDGLPLAIELAAAWIRLLTAEALLARLERRLEVLVGGAVDLPERQRTMRRTLQWSYDLLTRAEQALFRRLSAFSGGAALDAIAAVCGAAGTLDGEVLGVLASLVDKGLVSRPAARGEPRVAMLETIREYGRELLDASGEAEATAAAHAAHHLAVAEASERNLTGPDQAGWLPALEVEQDNFRAALRWSLERGDVAAGLRLAAGLWRFWDVRGHRREGLEWLEALLARSEPVPAGVRANALAAAGNLAWPQGAHGRARDLYEAGLALHRDLGDLRGTARALSNLGLVAYLQGDLRRAASLHRESLAARRTAGDRHGIAVSLNNLAVALNHAGDHWHAAILLEEALSIRRSIGDVRGTATTLLNMGELATWQGDHEHAAAMLLEGLDLARALGDERLVAKALVNLGDVARSRDDLATAGGRYEESLAICVRERDPAEAAFCLEGLAAVARGQGSVERAARLCAAAAALRGAIGAPLLPRYRAGHDQIVAQVRADLSPAAFEAAWDAGRSLALEQAAAEALSS
jgi:predicted ATPase/transcriptional regulator with XRE-family HTH domain